MKQHKPPRHLFHVRFQLLPRALEVVAVPLEAEQRVKAVELRLQALYVNNNIISLFDDVPTLVVRACATS